MYTVNGSDSPPYYTHNKLIREQLPISSSTMIDMSRFVQDDEDNEPWSDKALHTQYVAVCAPFVNHNLQKIFICQSSFLMHCWNPFAVLIKK